MCTRQHLSLLLLCLWGEISECNENWLAHHHFSEYHTSEKKNEIIVSFARAQSQYVCCRVRPNAVIIMVKSIAIFVNRDVLRIPCTIESINGTMHLCAQTHYPSMVVHYCWYGTSVACNFNNARNWVTHRIRSNVIHHSKNIYCSFFKNRSLRISSEIDDECCIHHHREQNVHVNQIGYAKEAGAENFHSIFGVLCN